MDVSYCHGYYLELKFEKNFLHVNHWKVLPSVLNLTAMPIRCMGCISLLLPGSGLIIISETGNVEGIKRKNHRFIFFFHSSVMYFFTQIM